MKVWYFVKDYFYSPIYKLYVKDLDTGDIYEYISNSKWPTGQDRWCHMSNKYGLGRILSQGSKELEKLKVITIKDEKLINFYKAIL